MSYSFQLAQELKSIALDMLEQGTTVDELRELMDEAQSELDQAKKYAREDR